MKLDITATVRPDPLERPGHVQVRLKAVACDDTGKPYIQKKKRSVTKKTVTKGEDGKDVVTESIEEIVEDSEVFTEREVIIPATDLQKAAKSVAQGWQARAHGRLMAALISLGLVTPKTSTPETFKIEL